MLVAMDAALVIGDLSANVTRFVARLTLVFCKHYSEHSMMKLHKLRLLHKARVTNIYWVLLRTATRIKKWPLLNNINFSKLTLVVFATESEVFSKKKIYRYPCEILTKIKRLFVSFWPAAVGVWCLVCALSLVMVV
jgi:hypothetical protein